MRSAGSSGRPRAAALVAVVALAALAAASCGSRGPLDDTGPITTADAAGQQDGADASSAAPDASSSADAGQGIVACGRCLFETCGPDAQACFEAPACRAVLQCALTQCLGGDGGGISTSCITKCASSDPVGALQVFGLVQCVTGQCGGACESALDAIGR